MYLRTLCDRELYLSLFKNTEQCIAAGIPVPLKARPGVQLVTASGREFEAEQYDELIRAIPNNVIHEKRGTGPVDPLKVLANLKAPVFVLQPEIEPENFRGFVLDSLGLSGDEKAIVPKFSGLKPDVLFVHHRQAGESEILPNGTRKLIRDGDDRLAISVIDLKNVSEGNPSYSAEVCLYAFFFANWLQTAGAIHKDRFYVSDRVYLWKHTEMPSFNEILGKVDGANIEARIEALMKDLEEGLIDYLIYMPTVRKFFKEDLVRVILKGDGEGWHSIPFHVNSKCGSCDWLGNADWLTGNNKALYDKNPGHYCMRAAEDLDHLSKLPNISKGASQILDKAGHSTITHLARLPQTSPLLSRHALLKRDKLQLRRRATAIITGQHTFDETSKIGGLGSSLNAEYDIIVHFDAGSGYLTGIALRGILFAPYGQRIPRKDGEAKSTMSFREHAFVPAKDNLVAEWVTLKSFIVKLSEFLEEAERIFSANRWGGIRTQICFWELRQYEELCNAFGRHLLNVLALPSKHQRALAWIFPSDELMEKDSEVCPSIVFIGNIVDTALHLPVKFENTILSVASFYYLEGMEPRRVDKYYREPLGNAIPRERIFEIWKTKTGVVRMAGEDISVNDAVLKYESVLKAHVWALATITARLRNDLRGQLVGKAPILAVSGVSGANGVAYDSKLWLQWGKVNAATAAIKDEVMLMSSAERLEASYEAIILLRVVNDLGGGRFIWEVNGDSTEAKLEEGKSYVLGIGSQPGYPLMTPLSLGIDPSNWTGGHYKTKLYDIITVELQKFDRIQKQVTIRLKAKWFGVENIYDELMSRGLVPLNGLIYLADAPSPDFSDKTAEILSEVGNPTNALNDVRALTAMGKVAARSLPRGQDAPTPISEVLWQAGGLAKSQVRNEAQVNSIIACAVQRSGGSINSSQQDAIRHSVKNRLSVIWGPPGTGKTNTLAAMIHAIGVEGQTASITKKILVTGPNYRAVEEIVDRLFHVINGDTACEVDLYMAYSSSRQPRSMNVSSPHLNSKSLTLSANDSNFQELAASIRDSKRVTIVFTTVHIISKLAELLLTKSPRNQPIFDFVVIDESSQVEVSLAIQAFSVLKTTAQLVIAGDHLQMPPITSLSYPVGAEYLVGSIQAYFIKRFNLASQNLLTNYRSNQALVDYAKSIGYDPNLQASNHGRKLKQIKSIEAVLAALPENLPETDAYAQLLHVDRIVASLIHDDVVSSQANETEAKLVAGLVFCLRHTMAKELDDNDPIVEYSEFTDNEFFNFGVGIVTPHKAQKALIIRELHALFPNTDPAILYNAVDTVEKFQGGQRQTIIVSFGVGDVDVIQGEEAFLLQLERTNVAVSRAQAKCIVIMPKTLAYHLPSDMKTAQTARALKSYIEEFCNSTASCTIELGGEIRSSEVRWHQ